jgi:hypothetical protein
MVMGTWVVRVAPTEQPWPGAEQTQVWGTPYVADVCGQTVVVTATTSVVTWPGWQAVLSGAHDVMV